MASEITKQLTFNGSKGGVSIPSDVWQKTLDMAGDDMQGDTQVIGTTEEAIVVSGDIGTVGQISIKNLDSTNYVEIGYAAGVYVHKLIAGDFMMVPLASGVTVYAKANTSACRVSKKITEL